MVVLTLSLALTALSAMSCNLIVTCLGRKICRRKRRDNGQRTAPAQHDPPPHQDHTDASPSPGTPSRADSTTSLCSVITAIWRPGSPSQPQDVPGRAVQRADSDTSLCSVITAIWCPVPPSHPQDIPGRAVQSAELVTWDDIFGDSARSPIPAYAPSRRLSFHQGPSHFTDAELFDSLKFDKRRKRLLARQSTPPERSRSGKAQRNLDLNCDGHRRQAANRTYLQDYGGLRREAAKQTYLEDDDGHGREATKRRYLKNLENAIDTESFNEDIVDSMFRSTTKLGFEESP